MVRRIALATALAGSLDIAMAAIDAASKGGPVGGMLRSVASGPFPGAAQWGPTGAALGLLVHFAIMAVMASLFIVAHDRIRTVRDHPLVAGAIYGVLLWLIMYGLVLRLRFGAPFPSDPVEIAKQLFAHVALVGLPIAWIASRDRSARRDS